MLIFSIKNHVYARILALLICIVLNSCENFLEVEVPNSKVPSALVFIDDATANSALAGIYIELYSNASFAGGSSTGVVTLAGLSADELKNNPQTDQTYLDFQENNIDPENSNVISLWASMYKSIYETNAVLEGLSASSGVTASTRDQLQGEALFIRAFCNFYLVNLFGDVPLVTTTDYKANSKLSRTPVIRVYDQVKEDLLAAEELLPPTYVSAERIRPNKSSAIALLSRVYLYTGDWERAEEKATKVIVKTDLYDLESDLNKVFLANSQETIWQLRPQDGSYYTNEGHIFSIDQGPKNNILNDDIVTAFEAGDNRKTSWITSTTSNGKTLYLPHKYKMYQVGTLTKEYSMVLRLSELYLIRAEARAQQGKFQGAIADIDKVRVRAGLPLIQDINPGSSQEYLLRAIEHEKRIEFLVEWGHRWFDLKRWNRIGDILAPIKTGWTENDSLYPMPQDELNKNTNLRPQNPGY